MATPIVLSLGAGVQSSTILLMACKGILPKPDVAIFADTHAEPPQVYKQLWWLASEAAKAGIPVIVASKGNLKDDALRSLVRGSLTEEGRWVSLPYYTKDVDSDHAGRLRQQCSKEYKLDLIHRFIREEILGVPKHKRVPYGSDVVHWMGISWDEHRRMRMSGHYYITNSYPLIGWPEQYLEKRWTRAMCKAWFAKHYPFRTLARSSCIFCPMHSNAEWREMRDKRPAEWQEAIAFDAAIRTSGGARGDTFLHPSCLPLNIVPLDQPRRGHGELSCMGMCDT